MAKVAHLTAEHLFHFTPPFPLPLAQVFEPHPHREQMRASWWLGFVHTGVSPALCHAGKPLGALIASAHHSTMPAEPSTTTDMPSTITCVASSAPLTSGMPNSRATIAACVIRPPTSVTAALAMLKSGVQIGVVAWATSTSPGWKR